MIRIFNVVNPEIVSDDSSMQLAVDARIPDVFGGVGGEAIYIG